MLKIKKCFIFILVLLAFQSNAQTPTFELNGTIIGIDSGVIQFYLPKTDSLFNVLEDKVTIKNGRFTFRGQLSFQDRGIFIISSRNTIETDWIYIDTGKQSITIQIDSPVTVNSNSRIFNEFENSFKPKIAVVNLKTKKWKQN